MDEFRAPPLVLELGSDVHFEGNELRVRLVVRGDPLLLVFVEREWLGLLPLNPSGTIWFELLPLFGHFRTLGVGFWFGELRLLDKREQRPRNVDIQAVFVHPNNPLHGFFSSDAFNNGVGVVYRLRSWPLGGAAPRQHKTDILVSREQPPVPHVVV